MVELSGSCLTFRDAGHGCPEMRGAGRSGQLVRRADEVPTRPAAFLMPCRVAESCCQVAGFTGMVVLSLIRAVFKVRVDGAHPRGERVLVVGQVLDHPG